MSAGQVTAELVRAGSVTGDGQGMTTSASARTLLSPAMFGGRPVVKVAAVSSDVRRGAS